MASILCHLYVCRDNKCGNDNKSSSQLVRPGPVQHCGKNLRRTYQVYGALCGALPQVAEQI